MATFPKPGPLPSAPPIPLSPNATLQPPLSRRGHGPGLVLLTSSTSESFQNETLDPSPIQKWAEEGYAVVEVKLRDEGEERGGMVVDGEWGVEEAVGRSVVALEACESCDDKGQFGVVVYKIRKTDSSSLIQSLKASLDSLPSITAIISYDSIIPTSIPQLLHIAGPAPSPPTSKSPTQTIYHYPNATSTNFISPSSKDFRDSDAGLAHTRCLTFFKKLMGAPYFDLEAIWDEHCYFEFGVRDVDATMGTMVQEPYVNHIPVMTGGIGRAALTSFYRENFVFDNPDDTVLELVSRTVGIDRVIDEFIFGFTHDKEIDWLAPGIPPTGKAVRVPMNSIVNVRGDRLYHEHISWDQASLLSQLGLLPSFLPFPYQLPGGIKPAPGKRFEYHVPAAGVETADKLVNEKSVASNGMLAFKVREVDDA